MKNIFFIVVLVFCPTLSYSFNQYHQTAEKFSAIFNSVYNGHNSYPDEYKGNEHSRNKTIVRNLRVANAKNNPKIQAKHCLDSIDPYAIRKVAVELTPGETTNAYQFYYFKPLKENEVFGIYFQSDAVLKDDSLGKVLYDFGIIETQNSEIFQSANTFLSYFVGIYFYDLDVDGHLQINLCSPGEYLGDRKVFRVNCCTTGSISPCDINPDNNTTAVKVAEYRLFNPDIIYAANAYSFYFRSFDEILTWAVDCSPKIPKDFYDKIKSVYNCNGSDREKGAPEQFFCGGNFKYRIPFINTVTKFQNAENSNIISVFFDRNGDLYPTTGSNVPGSLICQNYTSVRSAVNTKEKDSFDRKEGEWINAIAEKINGNNQKSGEQLKITFLLVGYNNGQVSTNEKLNLLIAKIKELDGAANHYFIKVFWDGTFDPDDKGLAKANNLRFANGTSYLVGEKLRRIIKAINSKDIYFITHSLGANVACQAMFNQISKIPSSLQVTTKLEYQDWNQESNTFSIPVNKNFHALLVAPAMPGENTFVDLIQVDGSINSLTKRNNYEFLIGVNTKDEALNKEFLVKGLKMDKKFSSTSLGCDVDESKKIIKMMDENANDTVLTARRDNIAYEYLDFSAKRPFLTEHLIVEYLRRKEYTELLRKLYE